MRLLREITLKFTIWLWQKSYANMWNNEEVDINFFEMNIKEQERLKKKKCKIIPFRLILKHWNQQIFFSKKCVAQCKINYYDEPVNKAKNKNDYICLRS